MLLILNDVVGMFCLVSVWVYCLVVGFLLGFSSSLMLLGVLVLMIVS